MHMDHQQNASSGSSTGNPPHVLANTLGRTQATRVELQGADKPEVEARNGAMFGGTRTQSQAPHSFTAAVAVRERTRSQDSIVSWMFEGIRIGTWLGTLMRNEFQKRRWQGA